MPQEKHPEVKITQDLLDELENEYEDSKASNA